MGEAVPDGNDTERERVRRIWARHQAWARHARCTTTVGGVRRRRAGRRSGGSNPTEPQTQLHNPGANKPSGRTGTLVSGMATTTTSAPRTAPPGVAGVAPVSAARSASVTGPRELATETSCPMAVSRRVSVPPMWPG